MSPGDDGPRIGVAGAGSLGFHHIRIARDLPGGRMAGFFEPRVERRDEVAEELEVRAHDSLDALLAEVDGLVIATPTTTHEEVAVQALEAGVHVFIEKPIAASLDEADRILAAAESAGAKVQVGHVERFNRAVVAARPYLDEPLFVESHRLAPFTERGTDVAVVLDLMIHDVDLVGHLVGRPVEGLDATGVPVLTPSVDIANARVRYDGGAVANLTASRVSMERMRKVRIFQRSGYLSLNLADGSGYFLRLKGDLLALQEAGGQGLAGFAGAGLLSVVERIELSAEPVEPLRLELESFRDAIRGEAPPAVSGREGREALALALEIEERIMAHVADSRTA
jgi:predicted dehydrogenase